MEMDNSTLNSILRHQTEMECRLRDHVSHCVNKMLEHHVACMKQFFAEYAVLRSPGTTLNPAYPESQLNDYPVSVSDMKSESERVNECERVITEVEPSPHVPIAFHVASSSASSKNPAANPTTPILTGMGARTESGGDEIESLHKDAAGGADAEENGASSEETEAGAVESDGADEKGAGATRPSSQVMDIEARSSIQFPSRSCLYACGSARVMRSESCGTRRAGRKRRAERVADARRVAQVERDLLAHTHPQNPSSCAHASKLV